MTWWLLRYSLGSCRSRLCMKAIPFATSMANCTARAESTTSPVPWCSTECRLPTCRSSIAIRLMNIYIKLTNIIQ